MRPHLTLRAILYPLLLIPILAVLFLAFVLCLRNGEVPAGFVNSRLLGRLAARAGVQYTIQSLHVGCFQQDCGSEFDVGGIALRLPNSDSTSVTIDSVHWCPVHPLSLRGLKLTARDGPSLQVGEVDLSFTTREAQIRNIRIATTSNLSAVVQSVSWSPLLVSKQEGLVRFESVNINGTDLQLPDLSSAPSMCQQTRTMLSAGNNAANSMASALERLNEGVSRVRRVLFYACFVVPTLFFLIKVWSLAWTNRWPLRLALGFACIAAPFAVYVLAVQHVAFRRLLMIAAVASVTLAAGLWFRFYRRAAHRYQRWEPFVVDVACLAIVLPMAAYNFDFGTPFRSATRLEIGQLNVTELSVRGSQQRCQFPQLFDVAADRVSVEEIKVGLPDASQESSLLSAAKLAVPRLTASIHDVRNPRGELIRASVQPVTADNIQVKLDWKNQEVRNLDARVHVRGILDTTGSLEELQKVPILQPVVRNSRNIDFAVDLTATGPPIARPLTAEFSNSDNAQSTIALQGTIAFDPQHCDLQYAWATRVLTGPIQLIASGVGSRDSVDVRRIQSLPGSAVQISRGAGRISLAGNVPAKLRLAGLKTLLGESKVEIGSTELSASTTPSCAPLHQAFSLNLNDAQIKSPDGSTLQIERSAVQFKRAAESRATSMSLLASIADARFASSGSRIAANIPSMKVAVQGTTTPERLPHRFDGNIAFSVESSRAVILQNETPLNVVADVWNGTINVPNQQQVLRQSILPNIPSELSLSMSLQAAARAFDAHIFLPQFPVRAEPIQGEIREVEADIRREANDSAPHITYKTGWNRVRFPQIAKSFCFDSLGEFDLSAEGAIKGLLLPAGLSSSLPGRLSRCIRFTPSPTDNLFRVQGTWPSLQLEQPSGFGIQIPDISDTEIRTLDLSDGRLDTLELDSRVSKVRTIAGSGELGARTHVAVSGNSSKITSLLLGARDAQLMDVVVNGPIQRPEITVTPRIGLEGIVASLQPFLSGGGMNLDGITPRARINRVHAGLQFERSTMEELNLQVDLAQGPLVSLTSMPGDFPLQMLDLALDQAGTAGVKMDRDALELDVNLPRLVMRASGSNGADIQTTIGIKAGVHGSLSEREAQPYAILDKLSRTISNATRQLNKAVQVFGDSSTRVSTGTDLAWKFRIQNSRTNEKALQLTSNNVGTRLAVNLEKLVWRRGLNEASSLSGLVAFNGDLRTHENQLVLDANVPIRLTGSFGLQPAKTFEANLPLLVVFDDTLRTPLAGSTTLWDSDYYSNFWAGYPVGQAARGTAALVDTARLTLGSVSVRQLLLPLEPLRIAVGLLDRLELHVPFAGRTLFGTTDGLMQVAVEWRPDHAAVNSNVTLALRNIQAGAFGLNSDYGHAAVVEDEIDGNLSLRTQNWIVNRDALDRLAALRPAGLDKINIAVDLWKSERSRSLPGVLQLSSDARVNTLNTLLNRIIRDVQLVSPPRRFEYQNFGLKLRVDRGKVATTSPWLTLEGVRISSPLLDLGGSLRLHGTRNGEEIELQHLLDAFAQ